MAGKWSSLFVITGVLATAVAADRAYGLELDPGRVLTFHSEPSDGCPGLDWHVVIGPNHRLTGFIAWDQMKDIGSCGWHCGRGRKISTRSATGEWHRQHRLG